MTQMIFKVTWQVARLMAVQNYSKLVKKHATLTANEITENIYNKPFIVYFSNAEDKPAKIINNTVIGHAKPAQENMLTLLRSTEFGPPREGRRETNFG